MGLSRAPFPRSAVVRIRVFDLFSCTAFTRCLRQHTPRVSGPGLFQAKAAAFKSIPLRMCIILNADTKSTISPLIFLKSFVIAFRTVLTCSLLFILRCLSGNKDVFSSVREQRVFIPQLCRPVSPYSVSFRISRR